MANNNETVREVCAEMHDRDHNSFTDLCLRGFADRILSAHEREMKRMNDCCDALEDRFDKKDAEIARLKAALKPVMECDFVLWDDVCNAVREAQRVMLEGGAK